MQNEEKPKTEPIHYLIASDNFIYNHGMQQQQYIYILRTSLINIQGEPEH